ncbi:MAG: 2-phosphosulfolactate phosphatase [Bacteroidia bacterium]|nr:2-phosphosulfolactate phosphatase [Bacteroidia bacterium]
MSKEQVHTAKTLEVCFSPALIHLHDVSDSVVVVIDILRATSSICVALANGVKSIVPVAGVEESEAYRSKGFLIGAERNGEMLDGFDLGNSPFSYMDEKVKGRDVALSTTNGTQAIAAAKGAYQIAAGSFLNLDVLCDWLIKQDKSVILLCSGWKNSFNLEDTLFAGAVAEKVEPHFTLNKMQDAVIAAKHLYSIAKHDMYGFLEQSSHRKRLEKLHIEKDIEYCLTPNQAPVLPVMVDGALVNLSV